MKESLANSYVFSVILVIVGICSSLIIVSMNYSKVFKMKNRVIINRKKGEKMEEYKIVGKYVIETSKNGNTYDYISVGVIQDGKFVEIDKVFMNDLKRYVVGTTGIKVLEKNEN